MAKYKIRIVARGSKILYHKMAKEPNSGEVKERTIDDSSEFKVPSSNLIYCTANVWKTLKRDLQQKGHETELVH